ncbi:hypothetical protein SAMN04489743_4107 [Pseudarthrobacter equi]|uniref:Uncharacterized protein n=1 Tax=Pseudarthrobacter equi TaxID=728066 RepID=A0A1H1S0D1_9MICC|nr:hypothetical protein [Pseudarthrobacter equi]SDS41288.1 hypothetical protein SAMN04489743_0016 [Pseudarthrobacter equi]SDT63284.1 hypothetical protein SAMN04489743_4107 [Pseudarthrobacter equi]
MTEVITIATAVIALLTIVVAWLTYKVSKESKQVAVESKKVAEASHAISTEALDVAIKDWKQVGREEPWSLTKLEGNYWLLERNHYDPAVVVMAEATPHCGGSTVEFQNPAGAPVAIFRRGSRIVLNIPATNVGTFLSLWYREFSETEEVPQWNTSYFSGSSMSEGGVRHAAGALKWDTALY